MNRCWVSSLLIVTSVVCGILTSIFFATANAHAEPQVRSSTNRIVLVRGARKETITARVRAELESDGWQVVEVEPESLPLSAIAETNGAFAAIRVHAEPPQCEIWVTRQGADAASDTEVLQGSSPSDAVLALRAVEVLRARLLKDGIVPPNAVVAPQPTFVPRRVPPPALAPVEKRPVWTSAGGALFVSPGGFSPNVVAEEQLGMPLYGEWVLDIRGWLPITAARNIEPEGTSRFWPLGVTAGAGLELGSRLSPWSGRVHTGVGALLLQFQTDSLATLNAHAPRIATAFNYVSVAMNRRLTSWLRLGAGVTGCLLWSRLVLSVTDRPVAHWGRPLIVASVNAEFDVAPRQ